MPKYDLADARVWVTGASSGIGRALAVQLAQRGCRVAVSARRKELLDTLVAELGEDRALAVPFDVTDRQANLDAVQRVREHFGGLDVAVLNAGMAEFVRVKRFDSAVFERTIAANYLSVIYGVEAALPLLRESSRPLLVGMSSTAGYRGLPQSEAYGASKAAIRFTLESLRIDLHPEGIPVSVIYPWFVRTPLTDANEFPMPFLVEVDRAARYIVDGMARLKPSIDFPKALSLMLRVIGVLPAGLYTRVMSRVGRVRPGR